MVVVAPPDVVGGGPPRPTGCGLTPGGGGGGVCGRLWASAGVAASSATHTDSSITRVIRLLYEMGDLALKEAKE